MDSGHRARDGSPGRGWDARDGWRAGPPWQRAHWLSADRRPGPLRRNFEDRVLGGVAGGISARTRIDKNLVRAAFVISTVTGGVGVAAYLLAWLFVPVEREAQSAAVRALGDRRGVALALGLVPALVLTLVIASALGAPWLSTLAWPLFIASGSSVLLWRNVSAEERSLLETSLGSIATVGPRGDRARRLLLVRIVVALVLAIAGVSMLTHRRASTGLLEPLAGLILVIVAALVAFGPWWLRIVRDLVDERQARVRAEERADLAARLHDSVLQTLALIQRHANDPQEVVTLARAQERDLRNWLFEGRAPGMSLEDETLVPALERLQGDVERLFGVPVETVVVGDCPLNDDMRTLLEAGREATVNAAKWSGAPVISVFVEVDAKAVAMFVRDRGKGFDETAVGSDRRGLAESIRGRMARHGGRAEIRTSPGAGTEVVLTMPRRNR